VGDLKPVWAAAPRRAPGMSLPPYRFRPGVDPRPGIDHVIHADPFEAGIDLYHHGYLWEAHEAWEAELRSGGDPELLKGLIQLAAGLLKAQLGNERGMTKLLRRSRRYLESCRAPRRLDLDAVIASIGRFRETRDLEDAPHLTET